jgi:HEAT repeat protein
MKRFTSIVALLLWLTACERSPDRAVCDKINALLAANCPYTAIDAADAYLKANPDAEAVQRLRIFALLEAGEWEQVYSEVTHTTAGAETLEKALRYSRPEVRRSAANFVADYGIRDVSRKSLLKGLKDAPPVRAACIRALGVLYPGASARSLYTYLQDSDWRVRAAVVTALGRVANDRVVGWIIGSVDDPDGYVRFCALQVIANRPRGRTLAKLNEMLPRTKGAQKLEIALAMARLGETNGVPLIQSALKWERPAIWLMDTITDLPASVATNLLYDCLSSTNRVIREHAITAWKDVARWPVEPSEPAAFPVNLRFVDY